MNTVRWVIFCLVVLAFSMGISAPHLGPVLAQDGNTCPGALPSRLIPGEGGRVTPGDPNSVRDQPSLAGQRIGQIPGSAEFEVISGPVCADGYAWWYVRYWGSPEGWTVENFNGQYVLEPYPQIVTLDGNDITYDNLSFSFDPVLGSGVRIAIYEADPATPDMPYFAILPDYSRIMLRNYPVQFADNPNAAAEITIFSVDEYVRINDAVGDIIGNMSELLTRADSLPPAAFLGSEMVSALPLVNAGMVFQVHRQSLEFQNGAGFRFIGLYAQNVIPLSSDMWFNYFFQGLTADGKYWVSLQFPVRFPLPADLPPESEFDWEAPEAYYEPAIESLQKMAPSDFTPDLALLDALVASMIVTGDSSGTTPAAAPAVTCTVKADGANIRSGPGTGYSSIGTLVAGQSASVDGQATGTDGYIWWRLASGGWLRSDVTAEQGACDRVPVVGS